MSKVASHRKNTKAGIDIDEARRKREDNIIELRKNKRDENLLKKRSTFATPQQYAAEDSTKGTATGQRVREILVLKVFAVLVRSSRMCLFAVGRAAHDGAWSFQHGPVGTVRRHAEVSQAAVHWCDRECSERKVFQTCH
jgi:hypothetical protein